MQIRYQPFDGKDGPRPVIEGIVFRQHADGAATLHLFVPGGAPAMVIAREGTAPGTWHMATVEPAPVAASDRQYDDAGPVVEPEPAPPAEPEPASLLAVVPMRSVEPRELQTCKLCLRKHRGPDYMYCGDRCRADAERSSPAPVSRRGKKY